jgi:GNAT superfamily N-acetyltransferase
MNPHHVRAMTSVDVDTVARIHRDELPHGLFPHLGERFLRAYYDAFVASPHAIGLVATTDDEPVAFAVGTTAQAAHHRWTLRNHGVPLALRGAAGLLTHPSALRLLRGRLGRYRRILARLGDAVARRRSDAAPTRPDRDPQPVAVLMHIAVAPEARGHGLGRALAESFTDRLLEVGCTDLRLVTADPETVGPFYEALGWVPAARRQREDGVVTEYRYPASARGARRTVAA